MVNLFTTILNMSLTSSVIILIVLLARLCLKRAPKVFSYVLWSVVLFRLLCPVSLSLPISVLSPVSGASSSAGTSYTASMEYISIPEYLESELTQQTVSNETPALDEQINTNVSTTPETNAPATVVEQQTMRSAGEIVLTVFGWLWITGMVSVLGFTVWQTISLRRMLADACIIRGNIFESEKIGTAFILGVINPKIYLPLDLPFDIQKAVVAHEQTHQRRGDHIVKLVSYIALAIHWFNPLVWLSFKLMCNDMEKSCDEAVLREMNNRGYSMKSIKKAYGNMLLVLGGGKQHIFSPVSFAENSTKERVKNVVEYSRVARNMSIILVGVCAIVLLICVVNPTGTAATVSNSDIITSTADIENVEPEHAPDAVQLTVGDVTFWSDVVELNLSGHEIRDFSPITECTNLISLDISNTGVTDLSFLASLTELKHLDVSGNCELVVTTGPYQKSRLMTLENEEVIGTLTNLRSLNLSSTGIEEISFVSSLALLEELSISENYIDDISCLNANTNLKKLYFMRNYSYFYEQIPSLVFPHGLTKLEELHTTASFSDLNGLAECTKMRVLVPPANINDLSILSGMRELEFLSIQDTRNRSQVDESAIKAMDLSALVGMSKLKYLSLSTSGIEVDIQPIAALTSLEELYIDGTRANHNGCEFVSEMKNLKVLEISVVSDLSGVENLTNLETLRVYAVKNISPIAGCKKLKNLHLETDVEVSELNALSGLTELTDLELSGPNISDLSGLSTLTNLKKLAIGSENLTDLSGLSTLSNLTTLHISCKSLSDISGLSSSGKDSLKRLTKLSISSDSLLNLNGLQLLTELTQLSVPQCNISDISALSSLNKLVYLDMSSNNITDVSPLFGLEGFRTGSRVVLDNPDDNRPYIDLLGNPLTDEQLIELYEALDGNTTIYSEDISIYG